MQRIEIFVILDHFLPLLRGLTTWKIKIWKKWKKAWGCYHFTHVYHKWQSHNVWFLRCGAQQTELFVMFGHFFPFYPLKNLENQNFEIMKKTRGDIIFLHMCTKGDNQMIFGSQDMECNRQAIFCPFTLVSWSYFILWLLNSMKITKLDIYQIKHLPHLRFYFS